MPRRRRAAASPDHYATLGVQADADHDDIKRAYRALALKFHPDKNSGCQSATSRLAEINLAWEVVGDQERRRIYDMQRAADGTTLHTSQRRGPIALARKIVLGSSSRRSFPWTCGLPYLRRHRLSQVSSHLRGGKSVLLYLHLGGSPRATRQVSVILELHQLLSDSVYIAALDVGVAPSDGLSLAFTERAIVHPNITRRLRFPCRARRLRRTPSFSTAFCLARITSYRAHC